MLYGLILKDILKDPILSGIQSVSLHWEDVPCLISSTRITGNVEEVQIEVMVNKAKGKGNSEVAFHVDPKGDSTNLIYWSWHVWVTDDPTNGVQFGHKEPIPGGTFGGYREKDIDGKSFILKFMDSNLGALSNNFSGYGWNKS